ncbi:DNA circularization N-terminal domain-containing protein [Sphingomonas sp. AR_OL41]|uniref:DNA circularization protein n=1 Tax=Sphingomonas sp. AR_OL41 TaxID=3042729 RepID=UPI0024806322|nr:DNA circularization N-terminal domain-containing protein [Sphingomonas sp. AR_OL41]MDH7971788.1 DNA circularization N-terminal domain-containing protein [Sphingomonas sp. AR_OL41]
MSAPAGWQKGSFRGAKFVTEGHEETGGRRLVSHEFPQANTPVLEDLGKKAGSFSITCHIIGDAYPADADALRDALLKDGVGTLIHPWYGSMQVGVDTYSRTDSAGADGGTAVFSITFLESGLPAVPAPTADTGAIAKDAANRAGETAKAQLASKFSVPGATAFVEDAANKLISGAAIATSVQVALLGGGGPALRAIQSGLGALGAGDLARDVLGLGAATVNLMQAVSAIGSPLSRIGAFTALLGFGSDLAPIDGTTPARDLQRDNQAAYVQLVNLAASAELVRAIADSDFASYQDATAIRDSAADALDQLALRQADLGDDAGAEAYDELRRAMIADVTARGGSLARLQTYLSLITEPALVLAYRIYGNATGVADDAAEICARNRVGHPGFVPGGQSLQVRAHG